MEGCRGESSWGKGSFDMVVGVNQPRQNMARGKLKVSYGIAS